MYIPKQGSFFCMLFLVSGIIFAAEQDRKVSISDLTGNQCWVLITPEGITGVELAEAYRNAAGLTEENNVEIISAVNRCSSHLALGRKYTFEELQKMRLFAVKYY